MRKKGKISVKTFIYFFLEIWKYFVLNIRADSPPPQTDFLSYGHARDNIHKVSATVLYISTMVAGRVRRQIDNLKKSQLKCTLVFSTNICSHSRQLFAGLTYDVTIFDEA